MLKHGKFQDVLRGISNWNRQFDFAFSHRCRSPWNIETGTSRNDWTNYNCRGEKYWRGTVFIKQLL